jgi:hypothetical protein
MSQDEAFEAGKVMQLQYQWPTIMCAIVPKPMCVLSCLVLSCLVFLYQSASTTTTAATSSV